MKAQLPLKFDFCETLSFDNFLVSNNKELIRSLKLMTTSHGPQSVFVWGDWGSGRSHLCQALYQEAIEENVAVAYFALSEEDMKPEVLNELEQYSLVILDDIDRVIGDEKWDEALFHFYNRLKESSGCLLMTSTKAPASFEAILPDLQSQIGRASCREECRSRWSPYH